jgi:hypothetical protein
MDGAGLSLVGVIVHFKEAGMKKQVWRLSTCLALAMALAACIPLGRVSTATVVVPPTVTHTVAAPSPTSAPPTATTAPAATDTAVPAATDTAAPAATDTAVPAATDTSVPSATPTADPAREVILISEPGLVSSVSSPVHVAGEADSTFEQHLVIQITGEDGAVLATTPTIIQSELGTRGPFRADVDFSVTADQPGRISVFSTSARDGGLVHLASVEVTLLASGAAVINPVAPHTEVHQIFEPALLATVTGGQVHVEGFSEYVFEANLNLALCGEGGSGAPDTICGTADNVIATGFTTMQAPDIGQPGPYETDLPYTVTASTRARLAVYSLSARDGGILHLTSVEITVEP